MHGEDSKVEEQVVTYACDYMNKINSRGMWLGDNPLDFSLPCLLLQLSLISIITRSIYIILKPFGQPLIVSQILGGVIIGPSILGRNVTFSTKVFSVRSRTIMETVSVFGLMLFIFLIGVKMDTTMVLRSGKKAFAIGILGFFIPYGLTSFAAFLLNHFLSLDHDISSILPSVAALQSITTFPVVACFLSEHNLLNSEIGRLASSSSIICDVCHMSIMLLKYAAKLAMAKSLKLSIGSLLSSALFIVLLVFGIRPAALWAIRHTPEGKPVKEIYIFGAIFALMGGGLVGELIGVSSMVASLAIGLVIPDGPPIGAALVERLDCFVSVLLMPLFFTMCGLQMDVFSIMKLQNVGVMQLIGVVAFIGKTVGTILPPLFCRMPFRDALSLALIMNTKGIVELAFLNGWKQDKVMNAECYAIMIILVVVVTGIISPIVKILYDPSRRFIAYKRRTILHSRRNDELRVLACLHNQENARAIMTLLQVSNPTKDSPIDLVVLHLVKLMGRDSSLLVAHREREKSSSNPSQSERIFNAFKKFEQHNGLIMVHCYKGISPYATMHNDVCSLAMENRTILIIVPFHKQYWAFGEIGEMVESSNAFKNLNRNVLNKAPCSVGIFIDRGNKSKSQYIITEPSLYQVAVFFFGGLDDREALAYARRMSEHPCVTLHLIRFTASNSTEVVGGTERGKMLDADILSNFKVKTLSSDRVSYREEVVASGMDVLSVTRSIAQAYDLVMVGRRHWDSQIMSQLAKWNRCGELGAVGEILAASDLKGGPSVLVVQQQTRLWGLQDPEESTHLRKISL
ncbi:cation/H(+) antiporter 15-like [Cornus florida]|uniref:cation/H(+) antiporter 15-like n=1 Tax=Cornus florida TaxID=4283 RepID=UPI00289C6616|nr:cation/H(+) antiporter 15-like [Cornus florida]